jgi:hypothetical protein
VPLKGRVVFCVVPGCWFHEELRLAGTFLLVIVFGDGVQEILTWK